MESVQSFQMIKQHLVVSCLFLSVFNFEKSPWISFTFLSMFVFRIGNPGDDTSKAAFTASVVGSCFPDAGEEGGAVKFNCFAISINPVLLLLIIILIIIIIVIIIIAMK